MEKIEVQDSLRKKKRVLNDALGDDILRYIAELLTNSDDSYHRMEVNNLVDINEKKVIYIELLENNNNYLISVTDNAEGMSKKTLKNIFGVYGGNNSGGEKSHTRGIFGQGASDVLRASAYDHKVARIETIKDNRITILNYKMDRNLTPSIEIDEKRLSKKQMLKYREELKIPNNGTKITFGISKRIKFSKKIRESLPNLIEKYPSFRYLLNKDNREIIYVEPLMNTTLSSSAYQFNEDNLISSNDFKFRFQEDKLDCHLKLYHNVNKKEDNTNIIVKDENDIVFDNTMFAFNNSSLATNVSGELLINGLYDLCYVHLNMEEPDAIIRDNRTGFDTKNPFYEKLSSVINPIIEKILIENGPKIESTDLTNNKKFNEALKKLNKYLASEIKSEISGGNLEGDGLKNNEYLKFARGSISLTKGKTYNIKLYINSDYILPQDEIKINVPENDSIKVNPLIITYQDYEINNHLVIKNISIEALNNTIVPIIIEAYFEDIKTSLQIEVIDEEIYYPKNGMEFVPNSVSQVYDKVHKLKLFVDKEVVPLDSKITIESNGLKLLDDNIFFTKRNLINDQIGVINISLTGGMINEEYRVIAKYQDILATANISLIDSNKKEKLGGGLISKIMLESSDNPYQSYFNSYNNVITINIKNPINIRMMGNLKDKDPNNPKFDLIESKYLCDIIATQAASLVIKKNVTNGEIELNNNLESYEKIEKLMQEHKNKIYEEMYPALLLVAENKNKK